MKKINLFKVIGNILLALLLIGSFFSIAMIIAYHDGHFTRYDYIIELKECCTNKIDTISFSEKGTKARIETANRAVPVFYLGKKIIINVCDYKILSKIKK